jgi:hypothetical protein
LLILASSVCFVGGIIARNHNAISQDFNLEQWAYVFAAMLCLAGLILLSRGQAEVHEKQEQEGRRRRTKEKSLNRTELLLEPDHHTAVGPFKRALAEDDIPFTSFGVQNIQSEYQRLKSAGVRFTQPPTQMGPVTTAVLDDTCGNLIQIAGK